MFVQSWTCGLLFVRCDLVIIANGKTEKIASGLLNPFLAHLKTAQDQIAKGGYSIILEPDPETDAAWFTKGTVERFVRFVSTPEVLERVTTIESEILQIENAIVIQSNDNLGLSSVNKWSMHFFVVMMTRMTSFIVYLLAGGWSSNETSRVHGRYLRLIILLILEYTFKRAEIFPSIYVAHLKMYIFPGSVNMVQRIKICSL
ncbi:hypothetical protein GW17_00003297 [Ensete ventricosum]|nr:hypothetical protein GW17_00003297 [Ensete ventricosum]RZR85181.1 hypothetical protein BHM03_00012126 [Ensete ventricosum]